MRERLRSLPVFTGPLPTFDPEHVSDDPVVLFRAWLEGAITAGAPEPHAMTLSTVDADGHPDARVLLLKDVDEHGWSFASSATSAKGRQLVCSAHAALSVYWPAVGRQVRVRGRVRPAGHSCSVEDFLARSPSARAETLLGRQSQVLTDADDVEAALADAAARLAQDPALVADTWTLYLVQATEVEFWQAAMSRRHVRLRYSRTDGGPWDRERLWP